MWITLGIPLRPGARGPRVLIPPALLIRANHTTRNGLPTGRLETA